MKASVSKRECGMSFLMVFKGERVTDPGWGLLCVIRGPARAVLFPEPYSLSPIWDRGRGWEGESAQAFMVGRAQAHREPTTREPAGPSLPRRPNPVLKHFLHSHPSLEASDTPSAATLAHRTTPLLCQPPRGLPKASCLSWIWLEAPFEKLKYPGPWVVDYPEFGFQLSYLPDLQLSPMTQYPWAPFPHLYNRGINLHSQACHEGYLKQCRQCSESVPNRY